MNKKTSYYYFREYFDFHMAVWDYIKHLYPKQKIGDKMQFSYTVISEDLKKIHSDHKFLIDLKKVDEIIPYNKEKAINDHYDLTSEDFEKILMLFWLKEQGYRVKSVEEQYDHYVMISVDLFTPRLEGIQKVNFETVQYNSSEEVLKKILTDMMRVKLTGSSPVEY